MKKKISHLIGSTLLCSILAINMLATPKISFAAQKSVPKGIVDLKRNTLYKYDLNGDDKVDEIKYTDGDKDSELKLYINNKLCLTRKSELDGFDVQVCDLDKNDNYLDLFICENAPNDCKLNPFFTRYNGEALDPEVAFKPKDMIDKKVGVHFREIVKLTGKGKFYIRNYTDCDAIGSFNCYMTFQLKDNAITAVPENTYKLTGQDKYKAAKSFQVYEKAGSKKVVYTVKKGNKVTVDKLYISQSGKGYLRIINSKGKAGWIKCDQKGFFINASIAG